MKKYTKPLMESEVFVANEYIGACGTTSLACINMNDYSLIYYDKDGDGLYESDELWDKKYMWDGTEYTANSVGKMNDCDTDGDATAGNHSLDSVDFSNLTKVQVTFDDSDPIEAYVVRTSLSNSPHFISVKTANHS